MAAVPLIISPTHSKETRLLATSAVNLHKWFQGAGVRSHILLGFGARKVPLIAKLNALRGQRLAVFYYGHGTATTLIGSEFINRPRRKMHLITMNERDPLNRRIISMLQGALIYTIACDSAETLGTWLVEHGIGAFVGSTKPMWITQDLDFNKDGVPDMTSILTLGPRRLYEGHSLAQSVEDYRTYAMSLASDYRFKFKFPELTGVMDDNINFYRVIGDGRWSWDEPKDELQPAW